MIGEKKCGEHSPMFLHAVIMCLDLHPFFAFAYARCGQDAAADIDDAHPADADWPQTRMMAKRGDCDAMLAGRFPYGGSG
jgi:hypothetical protein